jgi:hypothetical protein
MNAQMPTFFAFKNGQKINELVGANPQGLNVRAPPLFSSALLPLTILYCST